MNNQTHNFGLSSIGVVDSGFNLTVTSEELLEMYHAAKKNQQAHPHVDFFDLCRYEAIAHVANFVQENHPEYYDQYNFQEEHCTYEIASSIEDALGEVSEMEEREEKEVQLKDQ